MLITLMQLLCAVMHLFLELSVRRSAEVADHDNTMPA